MQKLRLALPMVCLALILPAQAEAADIFLGVNQAQSGAPAAYRVQLSIPRGWQVFSGGSSATVSQVDRKSCTGVLQASSWDHISASHLQPGKMAFGQGWLQIQQPLQGLASGELRARKTVLPAWNVDPLGGWRMYLWDRPGQNQQLRIAAGYRSSEKTGTVWHQGGVLMSFFTSGRCSRTIPPAWKSAVIMIAKSVQLV